MESFRSFLCCLIPGLKRNLNQDQENETRMEFNRKMLKQIKLLRASPAYFFKKSRILSEIDFDYSKILIVWGQSEELSREETMKKLLTFGQLAHFQERLINKQDGTVAWNGVVIGYKKRKNAVQASVELPKQVRHARAVLLKTVIEVLADCELLYLENQTEKEELTKVAICRRIPFRLREVEDIHKNLSTYGNFQTFSINHCYTVIGALCEVTYPYLTQAYLAMIMTGGLMTGGGILSASIATAIASNETDSKILKDAKECIFYFHQCFLPN